MLRVLLLKTKLKSVSGKKRIAATMKTNYGNTEMVISSTFIVARYLISRAAKSSLMVC